MGIEIGQVVEGKYRVTARIGEGGMGAVFAGEHLKLHRKVAIKTLHPAVAQDPEVVTRFEREAQAAGRIGNDHILEVFDIGELPEGDRYMVMEFLDGEALNTRLTRLRRMAPQQICPLIRQMLQGLSAAHAAGIVHRDLKPANVFILREKAGVPDYVKLIDFGISKFKSLGSDASQTRTGTIIGTPAYMSPEQARGLREADARSDIYAVGIIAYEAVTGRVPFEGASTNDLLFKIFLSEVPPLASVAPDVDPAFGTLVMKALAKEPNDRFATAEEFIAALDAWAQTGRGVVVPRSSEASNTVLEAARAPRQSGITAGLTPGPTLGTWEEQHASGATTGTRHAGNKAAIIVGLAIGALVVVLGVTAMFMVQSHAKATASDPTGVPSATGLPPAATIAAIATTSAPPVIPPVVTPPVPPAVAVAEDKPVAADAGLAAITAAPHQPPPEAQRAPQADDGSHHKHHQAAPTGQSATPHPTANPLDQL